MTISGLSSDQRMRLMRRQATELATQVQVEQRAVDLLEPKHEGGVDARHVSVELALGPQVPQRHRLALHAGDGHYDLARLGLNRHEVDRMRGQELRPLGLDVIDTQPIGASKPDKASIWRQASPKDCRLKAIAIESRFELLGGLVRPGFTFIHRVG